MMILRVLPLFFVLTAFGQTRPDHYTELIDYVQESPDQGQANTCLFMASTGAMELLLNKKADIKNPGAYGTNDLSESFLMWAKPSPESVSFFDSAVLKFNSGYGIHATDWPFEAWSNGQVNPTVWHRHPEMNTLPRLAVPKVEAIKLFQIGNKWATRVLNKSHVEMIKEALWKHKSPILINYNDDFYWHVILIVGYDDRLPGACHDTDPKECEGDIGSFYVRDSFGVRVELRDYDWFRIKANTAFVVKLK